MGDVVVHLVLVFELVLVCVVAAGAGGSTMTVWNGEERLWLWLRIYDKYKRLI